MTLHDWIRRGHRWLGIILTLTILTNLGTMAFGTPPVAITYAPLAPLFLLLISGLYMFFRPYFEKRRPS